MMRDYRRDKGLCAAFLHFYTEAESPKYMKQLTRILERTRQLLEINLDDVEEYGNSHEELSSLTQSIEDNTKRYAELFAEAADDLMHDTTLFPPSHFSSVRQDVFDLLHRQMETRLRERAERLGQEAANTDPQDGLPPQLMRRYDVVFLPRTAQKPHKLREIAAEHVGKLVCLQGTVTNMTDVQPLVTVATYLDDDTGCEVYQLVSGRTYQPLLQGPPQIAARGGSKKVLKLQTSGSKFVPYQQIKILEDATEVPQGSTPRTISVHLRGALTRLCKPGDAVQIAGAYLLEPIKGLRKRSGSGLLSNTYLEAMSIRQLKQSYQEHATDQALQQRMLEVAGENDVYDRLASSIAPEIFGHDDVKKALLLLMVGAATKLLDDGMKLRGDVHLCLMGDPGVAKSQLIKHIAHISPRAIYTTGKGSSGAGLTAAVQRDPVTSEMVLEGGALVLADKGICCIDEFDKMDESDRTNIHEVMEQQTISIAKAGITTSLNTRTSVLAAANPAWGRYDTRRTPAENINLPAALLSRFDLMWLILDKPDPEQDRQLAKHVVAVHREGVAPPRDGLELFPPELLRAYIAYAKTFSPHVPADLTDYIATVYAEMRTLEAGSKMPHTYTTPRTLTSILRLAQSLARLRFGESVSKQDIDEGLRLMRMSKISLLEDKGLATGQDPTAAIFNAIKGDADSNNKRDYTWAELVALLGRRFSKEQIKEAVEEYGDYSVFHLEYPTPNEPNVTVL